MLDSSGYCFDLVNAGELERFGRRFWMLSCLDRAYGVSEASGATSRTPSLEVFVRVWGPLRIGLWDVNFDAFDIGVTNDGFLLIVA